ncbi:putative late blight resistance protein homolog R1B-23 [Lycium barbarum]|uniref:putative late blight resistance protein homolog R1B-23 n=1 Tax=Lycium barbarum TaxID=112863 RepID=UPI00293E526F|nr:putative late blight resistance protein homolog R1B-23 [Lycium barbarum]
MAFAAVTVCLQTLDQIFSPNPFLNLDKDEHCKFLSEKLGIFQRFLVDSANKRDNLEMVEDMERRIRDVSYRAQDYVEELASFSWKDLDLVECYDRVYSTKGCLSQIIEEIKLIELEVMKIYEQMSCHANVYESESYLLESSPEKGPVVQDFVVGLDDDVLEIKTRLCSLSSKLEVVSLVGMGGIGKSTLARMVYDDSLIKYHFGSRAWVTVKDRQVKGFLLGLLDGIVELTNEIREKNREQLAEMLYKKLKFNRYIIILDDVWSTKDWDKIKRCFPDDKNGSRILLTTRLMKVALHAKSDSSPYCLKFLDLERSWELLCHKVFGRKSAHPDLEDIGKKIAEQCKGLPLAVLVAAGLLSKMQRTRSCWVTFAKTFCSIGTDEHKKCLDVLALSYRNLPHHLKACFIYMCAFPAEIAIHVQLLVTLWIAEGFLTTGKHKTLENYAEECLEDLVNRNVVIVKKRKSNGRVKSCAIHDLLRDLGLREAQREDFFHLPELFATTNTLHCVRRLSYHGVFSFEVPWKPLLPLSRTLFIFGKLRLLHESQLHGPLLYKLLRVLHIVDVYFDYFPAQVLQLVHLRYLALVVREPECPELISRLWNLQTFILNTLKSLNLPRTLWEMEQLRHVYLDQGGCLLPNPTSGFDGCKVLTNLQTVTKMKIESCTREVIVNVPDLKKLAIEGLGEHASSQPSSYYLNNLLYLKQLEKLKLRSHNMLCMDFCPSSLKKLVLQRCSLSCGFMSPLCMLPNLEILKMKRVTFEQYTWNLTEEVFSNLKYLKMDCLKLMEWNASCVNFPKLEHLVLRCNFLGDIPHEIGNIYTLQCIEVIACSVAVEMSVQRVQEEQKDMGNDSLNVSIKKILPWCEHSQNWRGFKNY